MPSNTGVGYCLFGQRYSRTSIQIDDSAPHFLFTQTAASGSLRQQNSHIFMGRGCYTFLLTAVILIAWMLCVNDNLPDAGIWTIILIICAILLVPLLAIKLIKFIIEFIRTL